MAKYRKRPVVIEGDVTSSMNEGVTIDNLRWANSASTTPLSDSDAEA